MKISAVIPTLNEEDFLEFCLKSLMLQTYPLDEIVVVDSGSVDNTLEIAKKYGCKIFEGIRNVGYNRELRTKKAKNDIILSADADTFFPPDWLERAIKYLENPKVAGVFGSIYPLNENLCPIDFWATR